jgi:hypothetical protein
MHGGNVEQFRDQRPRAGKALNPARPRAERTQNFEIRLGEPSLGSAPLLGRVRILARWWYSGAS